MSDYQRIASVIQYLDEHHPEQPDLSTLARHVGLSSYHFHRLFSRWAGITPKDFLQRLTLSHARTLLLNGDSVLAAALEAGLSGPSRLHDLCVSLEAASPGELKTGGAGWTIRAGFADSLFGTCLLAEGPRGICHLSFVESDDRAAGASAILTDWPRARVEWDDAHATRIVASLFARPSDAGSPAALRAYVRGSSFQIRVWQALLRTREGTLVSYGKLAAAAGEPSAARAVGTAVGRNPLAYLIPCHRVIRETGALGEYRWGRARKAAILAWESAPHANGSGAAAAAGV